MRFRIAVVASHPVQYQAPWYRALAALVDLRVFFAHHIGVADHARSGFGVGFEWDVPLLDGYRHEWLDNVARRPGIDRFRGCNTPGIRSILQAGRFDAVVVNGWYLLSYWQAIRAARRAGIPVLVRGDSQLPAEHGSLRRLGKRVLYPRLLRAFDACLTVGRRNHEYLRHYGVPVSRLYRSPHCVDNEFFAHAAAASRRHPGAARRALGIPDGASVFMFSGKLIEKKRPIDFLQALDEVRRDGFNVWGLVVGDGPLRPVLERHQRLQETGMTLAGFLNQGRMGSAYAASDALVLPSDGRETWGLVANEAMASGLPIIVSDQVGCVPDLIVEGRTGFSYPCGDVGMLAKRMRRLAGDPALRHEMRMQSLAHIREFTPERAAEAVVQAVEALAASRGTGARSAPARKRSGATGPPRATEPGLGAEPRQSGTA